MSDTSTRGNGGSIAEIEIAFDGNARQASGVDLPIVAINLPHRTDRWQVLVDRLASKGLDKILRAPAIDGRKLPGEIVHRLLRSPSDFSISPSSHLTLTPPAVGCFFSHMAVWRWMLRSGLQRALILEDDANPSSAHTPERFRELIASIPRGGDQVFFGRIIMNGLAEQTTGSFFHRLYYFNGTFAYLLTAHAARRLLTGLLPMHAHVDHQMSRFFVDHRRDYAAYYCEPAMFEPDWAQRSDCYVPIVDETPADAELRAILERARGTLIKEGRALLPAHSEDAVEPILDLVQTSTR